MTLVGAIIKKVKSQESLSKQYPSPPPELDHIELIPKKKKKHIDKFRHVQPKVDSSPPVYFPGLMTVKLSEWKRRIVALYLENLRLLTAIKKAHFTRGKVDCYWNREPHPVLQYFCSRQNFYNKVHLENNDMYKRIMRTGPRVTTVASHRQDWRRNRNRIIQRAQCKFVLFPSVPTELVEDSAFLPPQGVKRPRAYLSLCVKNCAVMGELVVELFTDICPQTCRLFFDLLDGDGLGHGYVGTCFFRKVPGMFWMGGDVIYNNGFGCYAQKGRLVPIGAENYHFSHSMPGLLSMRVTKDDEMCGIFTITFKPMPQFDLRNVVFGRVIRPCNIYESIRELGSPLNVRPVIELVASRRRVDGRWVHGKPNTRIKPMHPFFNPRKGTGVF